MASEPRSLVRKVEQTAYRCPGCGELVDNTSMQKVLEHHQHVLRAPSLSAWFDQRRQHTTGATGARTASPRSSLHANESAAVSGEARLRRYGH